MSCATAVSNFFGEYAKYVVTGAAIGALFGFMYLWNNNYLTGLSGPPAILQSQPK